LSPAINIKPIDVLGEKARSDRFLSDQEMFALWHATKRLPSAAGAVYRLLILSALRLNEAADASRSEIDRRNAIWVIPAARMKGKSGKAKSHAVPLTPEILEIFDAFPQGDFIFSTTVGASPIWISAKIKKQVDRYMLETLRDLAQQRGEDAAKVTLAPWKNHAIRHTVRTHLSALKVNEEVREAVLAHTRPGIKGVYDHYQYFDEKREALTLWAGRLRSIVDPPPANVVPLKRAG
jgi:integrase